MGDELARVLANPLRNRLLFEYAREATSPSRLARRLGHPVNLVSYHTRVLANGGYVRLVRTARRRGATEHFYRATVAAALEDHEWERTARPLRRALVHATLGSATTEAHRAALAGGFDGPRAHVSRTVLSLDATGLEEVSRVLRNAVDEIARIGEQHDGGAGGRPYEVVMLGFRPGSAP